MATVYTTALSAYTAARHPLRALPTNVAKAKALREANPTAPPGFPLFLHAGIKNQLRKLEGDPTVLAAF